MSSTKVELKTPQKGVNYAEGDKVRFFVDYQLDEGLLGEGIILKKLESISPLSFILEDNDGSPRLQEVWSYEVWLLEVTQVTELGTKHHLEVGHQLPRRLKCFYRVGVAANSVEPLEKPKPYSDIVDNFEIVKGWGQCF